MRNYRGEGSPFDRLRVSGLYIESYETSASKPFSAGFH